MEQRAFVRFLTLKKLSAREIMTQLQSVYGHKAFSLPGVKKLGKRFVNGRITLEDGARSERPPRIACRDGARRGTLLCIYFA
jgi:hypothetical protein